MLVLLLPKCAKALKLNHMVDCHTHTHTHTQPPKNNKKGGLCPKACTKMASLPEFGLCIKQLRVCASILAIRSYISLSIFSVCSWLVLNPSIQKSLRLIASSFSLSNCSTISSIAFFTRVRASRCTLYAKFCNFGLLGFFATLYSSMAACNFRAS